MIKRAQDMVQEIKDNMRGGSGSVTITHIFQQDEIGGKARLIAKLELSPGCSIGFHEHHDEEEMFYVLKGTATLLDQEKEQTLSVGDASLTKGGKGHSLRNDSSEMLLVLAVIFLY